MIVRIFSSVLLLWMLGFAWFAIALPQPLGTQRTDAVVVLTGGPKRIDRGLEALEKKWTDRMLITGVDRDVKPNELATEYEAPQALFDCCVDLGFRAIDTRSNALETASWLERGNMKSIRLVTTDWHMWRAQYELERVLPDSVKIYSDAVSSQPTLRTLFREYNKYVLRISVGIFGV